MEPKSSLLPEEKEILQKGKDYHDLTSLPGWKRLLDFIEQLADDSLGKIRGSESSDPLVLLGEKVAWKQREYVLRQIQAEALEATEHRTELLADLESHGIPLIEIEEE